MWPFTKKENPVEILVGLKQAQELLNSRFEKKQIPNEVYLKKAMELRDKIEKYEKKVKKLENN